MALSNPYANAPKPRTAAGLYPGSGVAQGGNTGRSLPMHMGSSATKSVGAGTPRAPARIKSGVPTVPGVPKLGKTGLPMLPGASKGMVAPTMTKGMLPPIKPLTIATPAVVAPTLGALSTHDQQYGLDAAAAKYAYDTAGAPITSYKADLATNAPKYQLGIYDTNHANQLDAESVNAALAARGAIHGGGKINADAERKGILDQSLQNLSEQYGPAAAARLQGQIDAAEAARGQLQANGSWSGQMGLDMQTAEAAALQRSMDALAKSPPPAPVAAPAAPAPKPVGALSYHRDHSGKINARDSTGRWFYNVHPPHGAKYI